jgi:hypothetical protein
MERLQNHRELREILYFGEHSLSSHKVKRFPCPTVQVATEMNRQFLGRNFHLLVSCILVAHPYIIFTYGILSGIVEKADDLKIGTVIFFFQSTVSSPEVNSPEVNN